LIGATLFFWLCLAEQQEQEQQQKSNTEMTNHTASRSDASEKFSENKDNDKRGTEKRESKKKEERNPRQPNRRRALTPCFHFCFFLLPTRMYLHVAFNQTINTNAQPFSIVPFMRRTRTPGGIRVVASAAPPMVHNLAPLPVVLLGCGVGLCVVGLVGRWRTQRGGWMDERFQSHITHKQHPITSPGGNQRCAVSPAKLSGW
jgi:hypothetical protein